PELLPDGRRLRRRCEGGAGRAGSRARDWRHGRTGHARSPAKLRRRLRQRQHRERQRHWESPAHPHDGVSPRPPDSSPTSCGRDIKSLSNPAITRQTGSPDDPVSKGRMAVENPSLPAFRPRILLKRGPRPAPVASMPRSLSRLPRLYVDAALNEGGSVPLNPSQAHYLGTVLRLKAGGGVLAFNSRDGEWRGTLAGKKRSFAPALPQRT